MANVVSEISKIFQLMTKKQSFKKCLLGKMKFSLRNRNFFRKFAWKNRNLTRIHDPQDLKPDWRRYGWGGYEFTLAPTKWMKHCCKNLKTYMKLRTTSVQPPIILTAPCLHTHLCLIGGPSLHTASWYAVLLCSCCFCSHFCTVLCRIFMDFFRRC